MAFPDDPLNITVELLIDGTWTDITDYVYMRDQIRITRGQQNESTRVDPSRMQLTLNNRDGRFTPRNPLSPYYGHLALGTPIRVRADESSIPTSETGFRAATSAKNQGSSVTCDMPTTADGDLLLLFHAIDVGSFDDMTAPGGDVRWSEEITAQAPSSTVKTKVWSRRADSSEPATINVPQNSSADGIVAVLSIEAGGNLTYVVNTDVDFSNAVNTLSLKPVDHSSVDVRWVVANPSGGTASFITPSPLTERADLNSSGFVFAALGTNDLTSLDDTGDEIFAVFDASSITSPIGISILVASEGEAIRFSGEVTSWPQHWDVSGTDVYTQLGATGILGRLDRDDAASFAAYPTFLSSLVDEFSPTHYYPFDSTHRNRTVEGDYPYLSTINPNLSYSGKIRARFGSGELSDDIPGGVVLGNTYIAPNPRAANLTAEAAFDFIFRSPGLGPFGTAVHIHSGYVATGDDDVSFTIWRLSLQFNADGLNSTLDVRQTTTTDPLTTSGSSLGTTGTLAELTDGELHHVRLLIVEDDPQYDWEVFIDGNSVLSGTTSLPTNSGTYAARTFQPGFRYNPGEDFEPLSMGHLVTWDDVPPLASIINALSGYDTERAGRRIERVCLENGIPLTTLGDLDETPFMGPQLDANPLTIIRECVDVDGGFLYESRTSASLVYRTLQHLHNQEPTLELDYAAGGELGSAPQTVNDDQGVINDITVSDSSGGEFRQQVLSGPYNVDDPPAGVGRYTGSVSVNVANDKMLPDQASWRIALGTVDEDRFPSIHLNLANAAYTSDPALAGAAAALDAGDKLEIANPPDWLPPETISQLALGFTENLWNFGWDITLNTVPSAPYEVAVYGDTIGEGPDRWDAEENSVLQNAIDTDDTSFTIDFASTDDPLWTTDDNEFPFDINVGGEQMTVSDISTAAGNVQTFMVTRSVNGVVKSHPAGARVRLWKTPRYGR